MSEGKSKRGCLWAIVAICALAIVAGSAVLLVAMFIGNGHTVAATEEEWGADEYPTLDEVWAFGEGDTKVVTVSIRGFISLDESSELLGPAAAPSRQALLSIRRATHDPEVRALILDIDSGGGGITASDVLYKALLDFRAEDPKRVIVAIFGDVAASGAYYIAIAADHIVAHPTTITGSIGVLMQSLNMRELGTKIGVHDVTIKSGANKDLLNPLQELSAEQRSMLQGIVDELHTRFVTLVAERRSLPEADVRAFADGRVLTATEAERLGLVDEIGYWDDAMQAAADLLDVDTVKVFRYEEPFSLGNLFRGLQAWSPIQDLLQGATRTRFLYQWQP